MTVADLIAQMTELCEGRNPADVEVCKVVPSDDAWGTDFEPVHDAPRPGDVKRSLADVAEARRLLGYKPEVSFEEGLRQIIDWYRWALETGYGGWSAR